MVNTLHLRKMSHRQITRLGGRNGAILRGDTPTVIPIFLAVTDYSTREMSGGLISPIDRRLVISTYKPDGSDLATQPDMDTDKIVLYVKGTKVVEKTLRLMAPPKVYDPHGVVCLIEQQAREG
jgi:hypothetical protein